MSDDPKPVKRPAAQKPKSLRQVPARLRWYREAAGLTLKAAADKADCSYEHLSQLENGHHSARVTTLAALAEAYGCKVTDIMRPEPKRVAA
jgi:transcriptional regulator with XRE-family HTH domain